MFFICFANAKSISGLMFGDIKILCASHESMPMSASLKIVTSVMCCASVGGFKVKTLFSLQTVFVVVALLLTFFQNLACGVLYFDVGIAKVGFFFILYERPLSMCFLMNGMFSEVSHFDTKKDSEARASVVEVVVFTIIGGYLCDDFVLFQKRMAGSHCTKWSLSACFCFLFLLSSLCSMS